MSRYCDICEYYSFLYPLVLTDRGALCENCLAEFYPEKELEREKG